MLKRKYRRIGLILLSLLLVLFLAGFIAARWYLAPFVKQAAESGVEKSSDGLYRLSIKTLRIDLLTGTVRARGLSITTDTARWEIRIRQFPAQAAHKITLSIESVRITRVHWWRFLKTGDLALNRIEIDMPQIDIISVQDSMPEQAPKTDSITRSMLDRLPALIAPHAKSIRIKLITVENARFLLNTKSPEKETIQYADSINWKIADIHLAAADTSAAERTLYADNMMLNLHHYRLWTVGKRYLFSIEAAQLTGKDSLFEMQHCSMRSVGDDSITIAEPRLRRPKVYFNIRETTVQGLDLLLGLHRNKWNARSILLDSVYVSLFNNMDLPLPLHRKMPNELWRNLKLPVNVDTLLVRNADIFYHDKTGDDMGKLNFWKANVLIINLSNDSTLMTDTTPVRVFASAQFMGTGDLSVALSIPLLSPNFYCPYQATLLNMPFASINALIEAKNNVRIDEGFADKISVRALATSGITRGSVKIYYQGLKISVLKEDSGDKNILASTIANLVIRNNSDDKSTDSPFRTANIVYRREAVDGFLRLLWRAAQSGLVNTLTNIKVTPPKNDGRDKKEQQKKAEKREKKAEKLEQKKEDQKEAEQKNQ